MAVRQSWIHGRNDSYKQPCSTPGAAAGRLGGCRGSPDDRLRFVGIDAARFRKPVEPGDQLILKATFQRAMRGIWKFGTVAEVDGQEVCSAEMMVAPDTKG